MPNTTPLAVSEVRIGMSVLILPNYYTQALEINSRYARVVGRNSDESIFYTVEIEGTRYNDIRFDEMAAGVCHGVLQRRQELGRA